MLWALRIAFALCLETACANNYILPAVNTSIVRVGIFLDVSPSARSYYSAAYLLAVQEINAARLSIFGDDISLQLVWGAESSTLVNSFQTAVSLCTDTDLSDNKTQVIGILGSCCSASTAILSTVAAGYNIPVISPTATSPGLSNRAFYPTLSRSIPSTSQEGQVIARLVAHFGWKRVSILAQGDQYGRDLMSAFFLSCQDFGIEVLNQFEVPAPTNPDQAVVASEIVEQIQCSGARIIIAFYDSDEMMSAVFSAADKLNMLDPPYTWILGDAWVGWHSTRPRNALGVIPFYNNQSAGFLKMRSLWNQSDLPFNVTGTQPGLTSAYVWDSVFALSLGYASFRRKQLNCETEENVTRCLSGLDYLRTLREVSFNGTTGFVSFDTYGDRIGIYSIVQLGNKSAVIGTISLNSLEFTSPVLWDSPEVPLDRPKVYQSTQYIDWRLFVVETILHGLGIVVCFCCILFNFFYRKIRYVKMLSPELNILSLLGCISVLGYLILLGVDERIVNPAQDLQLCHARLWLIVVGFTLAFGPLFAKTWRVQAIFKAERLAGKTMAIPNTTLYAIVFGLILLDAVTLIVYVTRAPLRLERILVETSPHPTEFGAQLQEFVARCSTADFSMLHLALYLLKGSVLAGGAFLAVAVGKVKWLGLNEGKYLAVSIYTVCLMAIVIVPVSFVLKNTPTAAYALVGLCLWFTTMFVAVSVLIPKKNEASAAATSTASDPSSDFHTTVSTLTQCNLGLVKDNAKLQQENAKLIHENVILTQELAKLCPDTDNLLWI